MFRHNYGCDKTNSICPFGHIFMHSWLALQFDFLVIVDACKYSFVYNGNCNGCIAKVVIDAWHGTPIVAT